MASGPVGRALAYLRRLSFDARWMTPSEVLGAIIADRRMLEIAATGPRERDAWRRLRFVVDQARAWSEVSHGGLRAYLAWAAHQGQETTRVAEAVLPETDTDAVKVMTIHAAKGLEFPIVILSGMTSESRKPSGVQLLWPSEGGYAVKLTAEIQTGDFEAAYPVDEQMDGLEKRRLLYVAATRARDHLVVSLHRNGVTRKSTAAQLLTDAGAITPTVAQAPPIEEMPPVEPFETNGLGTIAPPPEWESWLAELTEVRDRSRLVSAISASGLEGTEPEIVLAAPDVLDLDKLDQRTPAVEPFDGAQEPPVETPDHPGRAKGPRDVELPPWSKGRYGSAIGRAVHGVLQVIDLATANGLDDAVAAQSLAEGVTDQADLVRALVMSALDSDVVQRAATRDHWRETYVATVHDDGTILEGFVDLVYRDDDGSLVIVDYKTDAVPAGAIDSRVEYYRPQLRAYVDAHAAAQPDPVRAELLFLHPAGAVRAEVANSS
jgi:ATP-dependent exoDNAse (exonuclease V) beta subunit